MKNKLHSHLDDLVNLKARSFSDVLPMMFAKKTVLRKKSNKVLKEHRLFLSENKNKTGEKINISVAAYKGTNKHVIQMKNFLESKLQDDLLGAYIHGSLGNYDEISYSDFDALIIIRDAVFEEVSRLIRVALQLNEARKIMHDYDPLQHHGWFVLAECELENFDETYFPIELFNFSKSLFDHKGNNFSLVIFKQESNFSKPFFELAQAIIKTIDRKESIKNFYQLKSFLSRCMLLPALYYQAKYQKGIFKKFSFDEVKKDFSSIDWEIMNKVSKLRFDWEANYHPFNNAILKSFYYLPPSMLNFLIWKIPFGILQKLNDEFYPEMKKLIKQMESKLSNRNLP